MTIAAVGTQEGGVNTDNTTSVARAFGSNVTAGNLVVVVGLKFSPSNDAFVAGDCTQSAGTATLGTIAFDTSINFAYDGGASHVCVGIWSAIVTGTGSCTMQVAGGVGSSYFNLATGEYSATGGWDSARLDGTPVTSSNATDDSSPATTGNMTSTGGGMFVAGVTMGGGGGTVTITQDGAFTLIFEEQDSALHNIGSVIRRIVTGSTTDQGEWTLGSIHLGWAAAMVVYKEAAGGVPIGLMGRRLWVNP
jgi:hypothetical protein